MYTVQNTLGVILNRIDQVSNLAGRRWQAAELESCWRRGHTLLPRPRAGVHTGRGLASLIERSKSHNNSYNSHNYDPRDTSSKKLEISLYVYFDFPSVLPVNFTFYVYFDFTSLLPCHSCTYFNQNKCVKSE